MKILLEGKMEHDSLGRTSGKFPGRTKHPQLGTRLLGWGGGGEGREKNRDKQDKYRWAKRSQRLSGVSLLRSPIFFPFFPQCRAWSQAKSCFFPTGNSCSISSKPSFIPFPDICGSLSGNGTDLYERQTPDSGTKLDSPEPKPWTDHFAHVNGTQLSCSIYFPTEFSGNFVCGKQPGRPPFSRSALPFLVATRFLPR